MCARLRVCVREGEEEKGGRGEEEEEEENFGSIYAPEKCSLSV